MWEQFVDELRAENLGKRIKRKGLSVARKLQSAYELKLGQPDKRFRILCDIFWNEERLSVPTRYFNTFAKSV